MIGRRKVQSVISIIIPVYCAEKFLYKCINSILNQSYKEREYTK